MSNSNKQSGAVILIVLWVLSLVTVLVMVMASEIRLSAKTVMHQVEGAQLWADTLDALNKAQMELMFERMPKPLNSEESLTERKNPAYRFDGRRLRLSYPHSENVVVRIYNHNGKINLLGLDRRLWQQLLEKKLGPGHDSEIQDLIVAWKDWTDRDDLTGINGAERDYYQRLDEPYEPRNTQLQTVEELRLIRGFDEVFQDVNLSAAFTLYSNTRSVVLVNINLASKEALQLLPGLEQQHISSILSQREQGEFQQASELSRLLPPQQWQKLKQWVGFSSSSYYTIAAYPARLDEAEAVKQLKNYGQTAYMMIVKVSGYTDLPKVLQIKPFGQLPEWKPRLSEISGDEDLANVVP